MNGVGFEILAPTPVPQLPQSYVPTPRGKNREHLVDEEGHSFSNRIAN